jgi:2-methylisocitrate lyase-like PEP mutase family enzyme
MRTQAEKGRVFRELHTRPRILILPNPWDAGTAKLTFPRKSGHRVMPLLPLPVQG